MFYSTKIRPLVNACWAQDEGKMGPKNKLFSKVSSSQALTKEMWENESPEVHAMVEKERQKRYNKEMAEFNRVQLVGSQSPEQFQK